MLAFACALTGTAAACHPKPSPPPSTTESGPAATVASSSPAAATPEPPARRVIQAWSDALDRHDVDALRGLYAEQVRFYGRWLPRSAVVASKRAALSGKSTFRQQLVGDIAMTSHDDVVTAIFLKRSGVEGKQRDVRARLGLRKNDGGGLLIAEETDDVTEKSTDSAEEAKNSPAHAECSGTGTNPHGCDFETQACVGGTCQTCALGTRAMMTGCMKGCRADQDCPHHQICNFIAGDVYVCTEPAAPKACPRGQIFLKSDGECWTTCSADADCPNDMCCRSDFNAPSPICMARCWDIRE